MYTENVSKYSIFFDNFVFTTITRKLLCFQGKGNVFISYPHVVNLITFSSTFYNDMFYKSYTLKLSKLALSK